MKSNVITLTISNDLIEKIDRVKGPNSRGSYIRSAVISALEVDIAKRKEMFTKTPVEVAQEPANV